MIIEQLEPDAYLGKHGKRMRDLMPFTAESGS
jgi:hypothetical protein